MVARLADAAGQGVPIVGAEPSCLLTLRDEYPAVLPGDPRAQAVAAATRLPEELLTEAVADGRLVLGSPAAGKRILFHGHCHQKAVTGTAATVALLRAIPGAEVTEVDAGLLRHGRLVRLRGRALRAVHADRRTPPLPRRPGRAAGHDHRRDRGLLPSADRPRDRPAGRHPLEIVRSAIS